MDEWEALIKRRELLLDKISSMTHEVEKIDQRLAFLEEMANSKEVDLFLQHELAASGAV